MDLTEFALGEDADYTKRATRNYAIRLLSGLEDDPRIDRKLWDDLIEIGQDLYFTTFTDDSGYIKGQLDLSALDRCSPDLRIHLLDYLAVTGNYIVQKHVQDYREKNSRDLSVAA
jgi:hypothetical protein